MVSLALYLISLIPQGNLDTEPGKKILLTETFEIAYGHATPLNPQTGVRIVMETNGTLNIKVFNIHINDAVMWFSQQSPLHNWTLALLNEFAAAHADSLTRNHDVQSGKTIFEYVPPRIENVTIMVSNPTSTAVDWSYENNTISVIASSERIFLALMFTAPLGIVLTVAWLVSTFKERRKT